METRRLHLSAAILSFGFCIFSYPSVSATSQCIERDEMIKLLAEKYREAPVALGVTNFGGLVEVLKSAPHSKDDTWTIIVTSPKGISCLVLAGEGWLSYESINVDPGT